MFLLTPTVSHLLKASGVVLHFIWKHDQHAEIFPNVRQFENLTVHVRNEGQRKLGFLMHHPYGLRFILSTTNIT